MRNNIIDWQSLQPGNQNGYEELFFVFCDSLEVDNSTGVPVIANETGFGLEHAIQAWGDFWTEGYSYYSGGYYYSCASLPSMHLGGMLTDMVCVSDPLVPVESSVS